jgi:hypothetical protein
MIKLTWLWLTDTPKDWKEPWNPSDENLQQIWVNVDSIMQIIPVERHQLRYSQICSINDKLENFLETPEQIIELINQQRG